MLGSIFSVPPGFDQSPPDTDKCPRKLELISNIFQYIRANIFGARAVKEIKLEVLVLLHLLPLAFHPTGGKP